MTSTKKLSSKKPLGLIELIAIALGGMVGGGIFTVLGVSVSLVGAYTPFAIALGGVIALFAAYSYVKLGVYYKDEGATYSFYKKTFPHSSFSASLIGWWVIFGYISTLALYAYTFSSYALSSTDFSNNEALRKGLSILIIFFFAIINILSVKGMGVIEDFLVYTKLIILFFISFVLIQNNEVSLPQLLNQQPTPPFLSLFIVASLTFVAYEGFQLVINAVQEMDHPHLNIPRAIYTAIFLAIVIYVVIALGAILSIPFEDIIKNKEFALVAGAKDTLGSYAEILVITGALFATSSAISGTLFGASRQMAIISQDGYFPSFLKKKQRQIPVFGILTMSLLAGFLILIGSLEVILEFGSVTFLLVSLLMAFANHKIREKTKASRALTLMSMTTLFLGTLFILYYDFKYQIKQLYFILFLYVGLSIFAYLFSRKTQPHH